MAALSGNDGVTRADLDRRLARLARLFDLEQIRTAPLGARETVEYYDQCHEAYRRYHSPEGAVHMALNPEGRFDARGFEGQWRLFESAWGERAQQPPAAVLELAFGQGFNIAALAARHPQCRFAGVDLTPAHLHIARQRVQAAGLTNVDLRLGDYHALPYPDGSFDEALCVEAMCHAADLPRALGETARVLRPGGRLTLFDGYLPRPASSLDEQEALAVDLVARGLAVRALQSVDELIEGAGLAGLAVERMGVLDADVMPSLLRLERLTGTLVRFPWPARRALARRPAARSRNVLAGYLLRTTVALGLIGYRQVVLRKGGAP